MAAHTAAKSRIVSRMSAVRRSGNAIFSRPYARRLQNTVPRKLLAHRARALSRLIERARSVLAITLNFGFLLIVGIGAVVTAVLFAAFHLAFAPGVSALVLTLSIHGSSSLS